MLTEHEIQSVLIANLNALGGGFAIGDRSTSFD